MDTDLLVAIADIVAKDVCVWILVSKFVFVLVAFLTYYFGILANIFTHFEL